MRTLLTECLSCYDWQREGGREREREGEREWEGRGGWILGSFARTLGSFARILGSFARTLGSFARILCSFHSMRFRDVLANNRAEMRCSKDVGLFCWNIDQSRVFGLYYYCCKWTPRSRNWTRWLEYWALLTAFWSLCITCHCCKWTPRFILRGGFE